MTSSQWHVTCHTWMTPRVKWLIEALYHFTFQNSSFPIRGMACHDSLICSANCDVARRSASFHTNGSITHRVSSYTWEHHAYRWVMLPPTTLLLRMALHMWMSHVTHIIEPWHIQIIESCHTYDRVMSLQNAFCITFVWHLFLMALHVWMSHIAHMIQSYRKECILYSLCATSLLEGLARMNVSYHAHIIESSHWRMHSLLHTFDISSPPASRTSCSHAMTHSHYVWYHPFIRMRCIYHSYVRHDSFIHLCDETH